MLQYCGAGGAEVPAGGDPGHGAATGPAARAEAGRGGRARPGWRPQERQSQQLRPRRQHRAGSTLHLPSPHHLAVHMRSGAARSLGRGGPQLGLLGQAELQRLQQGRVCTQISHLFWVQF